MLLVDIHTLADGPYSRTKSCMANSRNRLVAMRTDDLSARYLSVLHITPTEDPYLFLGQELRVFWLDNKYPMVCSVV